MSAETGGETLGNDSSPGKEIGSYLGPSLGLVVCHQETPDILEFIYYDECVGFSVFQVFRC